MGDDVAIAFSKLMLSLDYPMAIVTTAAGGERSGCLVGFSTQVSIHPPRYLVCISDKNHTYEIVQRATQVAVHFPAGDDRELAELFGGETGDEVDKFSRCRWTAGADGVPYLDDIDRRFAGRIVERVRLGDHLGVVVEPVAVPVTPTESAEEPDLTFRDAKDIEPGHEP